MAKMRMRQAIAAAIADEMEKDRTVVLLGEDVGEAEGVFKTSDGLVQRFGPARVRDTPISEMGFLGAAVGAAATGLRPVVEIMFAEFIGVALDQLVTEAAKLRYLSRGDYGCPLVVRMSGGPGLGFGAQHSQTLETWFTNTPGLKLVSPSGPNQAYALLRAAIQDDDPVVVIEPRCLYGVRDEVRTGDAAVGELGRAEVVRSGGQVTVIGFGQTVPTALQATQDMDAEVIDLATLAPWDRGTVLESVGRTGRLAVIEANPMTGGWGADIAATVAAEAFGSLHAPVLRITCPDLPVPYSAELEARYVPSPEYVSRTLTEFLAKDEIPDPWWNEFSESGRR